MRTKDQAFDMFKTFKVLVENHKQKKIKIPRSDRSGEHLQNSIIFVKKKRIIDQRNASYTP